ncbi:GNAT family N-acetyltransferase [Kordia sp. YSTF-M3]|uniref:GNAT family N-acetyltransferase n=1 Tax=Kordia aestuariivivens TaxID=2759037 RepID=A0ABR7Q7E1_9FLAO|nr:GNAT family N-acetyltransferase [Kordia aestuariivivens]MBC8754480.1 GNAT family N-acetyltransferase [Kordia aestuariivivens]
MENHTIRKAVPADAKFISLLAKITFSETFGNLFHDKQDLRAYIEKVFSLEKMTSSLKKEENVFWIAYADELPVGYAKLKKKSPVPNSSYKQAAQLQKIYVLKDYLAHKIGTKLQNELFIEVQNLDIERLWLSVLHTNERAIGFYNKHDFHKYDSYSFSIGKEDFVFNIMMKTF